MNPPPNQDAEAKPAWTSRRRLLTALACGIPDRVPINTYELAGRNRRDWYNTQPSYRGLMDYIRQHTDCITNWNPQPPNDHYTSRERFLGSSHPIPIEVHTETNGDISRTTRICHTPKGDLRSITQVDRQVYTTWQVEHWCKSTDDVDKALSVPYEPAIFDPSDYPRVRAELGEDGIIVSSVADPAYLAADLMSFQDFLLWAATDTGHYASTVAQIAERVMENLRRQLACCPVEMIRICGPEYMTPPFLPPAMFARFMVPYVRQMTGLIHQHGVKVRLHCHGKINRVLPLFFETGCDATDPCEPPPDGDLELDAVKRQCLAHGVSVWGNIELKLLEHGTPQEVRAEVARIMRQAREGGGLVLMPTAAPINIPLSAQTEENYRAFIEAGREFGAYF